MWKGKYCDRDVAVKVLRTYLNSDVQKIIGVSCRLYLFPRVDAFTKPCTEVLQGGCEVETLQHPNVQPLIGVTMTETWMENGNINDFVKGHPDVDRFELVGVSFEVLSSLVR